MVHFGVAGYPPAFGESEYRKDRVKILRWLGDLGLDALELQMTYGPRMKKEACEEYASAATDLNISLSIHAAYYIVLTSSDSQKALRSIDTLKRTFELAELLGARIVVLHPGPLYNKPSEIARNNLHRNLETFFDSIGKTSIELYLETAGKIGQFGSIDEILELAGEFEECHPCIDFGHVHARTLGTLNSQSAINEVFKRISTYLHAKPLNKIHFHYTPIHFGPRGEIGHKALQDRYPPHNQLKLEYDNNHQINDGGYYHPRFEPIIKSIFDSQISSTIISETLNSQEEGAIAMRDYFRHLVNHNELLPSRFDPAQA